MSDLENRLRETMREISTFLGARTEPWNLTADDIESSYEPYCGAEGHFLQTPLHKRPQHREDIREAWETTEFQASWYVLRDFFQDEKIRQMTEEERRFCFLTYLYSNSDRYHFFNTREMALAALQRIGVIPPGEYGLPLPIPPTLSTMAD